MLKTTAVRCGAVGRSRKQQYLRVPSSLAFVWCYGPEFTSRRMLAWAGVQPVSWVHIQPGRPMQNGHVESFHDRLGDEGLDASWFRTFDHVRSTLEV
jgi:transposase InsO family protein